jgi:hypothetical protein
MSVSIKLHIIFFMLETRAVYFVANKSYCETVFNFKGPPTPKIGFTLNKVFVITSQDKIIQRFGLEHSISLNLYTP